MKSDVQLSYALLRTLLPWQDLSDGQLDLLISRSELLELYSGQVLKQPGDVVNDCLYLLNGQLVQYTNAAADKRYITHTDEMALLPLDNQNPRSLNIVAQSDCRILKIDADYLEKILCWGAVSQALMADIAMNPAFRKDYHWIKSLLESRLFYKIPPINIHAVLHSFHLQRFKAGEVLIKEGEEGDCCYLLKSGSADVFVESHGDVAVAQLLPGTVFGDDALVQKAKRNASVVMVGDGEVMRLEKQDFYKLLKLQPIPEITVGAGREFIEKGGLLLDVRTSREYSLDGLNKAINVPLHLSLLKSMMLDKKHHYLCASVSDERARAAAILLMRQGYNVSVLQGSIQSLLQSL